MAPKSDIPMSTEWVESLANSKDISVEGDYMGRILLLFYFLEMLVTRGSIESSPPNTESK